MDRLPHAGGAIGCACRRGEVANTCIGRVAVAGGGARRAPGARRDPVGPLAAIRWVRSPRSAGSRAGCRRTGSRGLPSVAPHHSTSMAALVGGGSEQVRPLGVLINTAPDVVLISFASGATRGALTRRTLRHPRRHQPRGTDAAQPPHGSTGRRSPTTTSASTACRCEGAAATARRAFGWRRAQEWAPASAWVPGAFDRGRPSAAASPSDCYPRPARAGDGHPDIGVASTIESVKQ